jgi:CHAT domain-containing protein/tetratricopeptide (TPR) repeat protein
MMTTETILSRIRTSGDFVEASLRRKTLMETVRTKYPLPDFSKVNTLAAESPSVGQNKTGISPDTQFGSLDMSLGERLELLNRLPEQTPDAVAWNLYHVARITYEHRSMSCWLLEMLDAFAERFGDTFSLELTCRVHAARSFALKHLVDADPFRYSAEALTECLKAQKFDFRERDFDLWMLNKYHEGSFRLWQVRTNYTENIERAIVCLKELLETLNGDQWLKHQRCIHNNLGLAYDRRVKGNKADNVEQALLHYTRAWEIALKGGDSDRHPSIVNNLGYIYRVRIRGDKAENIETAIGYLHRAWEMHRAAGSRLKSAQTLTNLGVAYCDRLMGDRRDNLHAAIRYYRRALRILDPRKSAGFRAWTLHNLGVAYHFLAPDSGGAPLEQAIACYEEALTIRKPEKMPMDWLLSTRNLSRAYSIRTRGDRRDNSRRAIALLDGTLDVVQRETHRMEWAQTQVYYGIAQARQIDGDKETHLETAAKHFRTALEIFQPDIVPVETREAALWLGRVLIRLGRYTEAETALKIAVEADRYRYRQMYISQSRTKEIETGSTVYYLMARALSAQERAVDALEWLEKGKIRILTEKLRLDQAAFERLPAEQLDACRDLTARLQALRIEHYIPGRPIADIIRDTRQAQTELDGMLREIRNIAPVYFDEAPRITEFIDRLPGNTAVIEFNVTEQGIDIFMIMESSTRSSVRVFFNKTFKRNDLQRFMDNWMRRMSRLALDPTPEERLAWSRYVIRKMNELSRRLMGPVYPLLTGNGIRNIVFVPHLSMHLLPLHLMPSFRLRSGALLMDDMCISYLPSITIGALSRRDSPSGSGRFLGISNPTRDLPWSDREVETIQSVFDGDRVVVLRGAEAVSDSVVQAASSADFVHFACHARFDVVEPYRSYLALAAPETSAANVPPASGFCGSHGADGTDRLIQHTVPSAPFYLADVFSRFRLNNSPLVVLSCCESGLSSGPANADEFIGFAAGFMGSGARAVLSSHWMVDDKASCILMERFYRNIVADGMLIPEALTDAQRYLRSIPEFSDPFFWGAFRIHGTV